MIKENRRIQRKPSLPNLSKKSRFGKPNPIRVTVQNFQPQFQAPIPQQLLITPRPPTLFSHRSKLQQLTPSQSTPVLAKIPVPSTPSLTKNNPIIRRVNTAKLGMTRARPKLMLLDDELNSYKGEQDIQIKTMDYLNYSKIKTKKKTISHTSPNESLESLLGLLK